MRHGRHRDKDLVRERKGCILANAERKEGYPLSHRQLGGTMKIGDLVRYFGNGSFGIIIDCDDFHAKNPEFCVHWIASNEYEWRFADELEVVHESR